MYDGKKKDIFEYSFKKHSSADEYSIPALLPNNIDIEIDELNVGGTKVNGDNANATAFNISIDIPRKNLYGFGSMYPHDRKLAFPARGNLSLDIIKNNLETGNLNNILKEDKSYNISIICNDNCPDSSQFCQGERVKNPALRYVIDNAVLKSRSTSFPLFSHATVSLNFDFTITRENGFLISGGCLDSGNAPGSNGTACSGPLCDSSDPIDTGNFDPDDPDWWTPTIDPPTVMKATPTPTPSVTKTVTPSISITPTN